MTQFDQAITVTPDLHFILTATSFSYSFKVSPTGELIHTHFGQPILSPPPARCSSREDGWVNHIGRQQREFPDLGHGDFRIPAIRIKHEDGNAIVQLKYIGYELMGGKPKLIGMPSTFSDDISASTLIVKLEDELAKIQVHLSYTIFPLYSAIVRSSKIINNGNESIVIEQAASFSVDMPNRPWEMLNLAGDWAREANVVRRKVYPGTQGFHSSTGYSSHLNNPFLALLDPSVNETTGEVYGFNLIWSGSHFGQVELASGGLTRVQLGLNPVHLDWKLRSGETFVTPECVAVYSDKGLGGMSRSFHRLYRNHLSRSEWTLKSRPVLLNNWEATYFDFDADKLTKIAKEANGFGVKLFVMDDGWFGVKYPRTDDSHGLGDWIVNPDRFPKGLGPFVDGINKHGDGMLFGIWVEPEMVNPKSDLYEKHPDWVLHSGTYDRTEQRQQLVLDLSLVQVQDYIIDIITALLSSANVSYVKWDMNRGMHEMTRPSTAHAYILGLYRILETLTTKFPKILWEGCASGGGRFDAGILHYWPQSWTSDNTDGKDRLAIQFGTSLVYPPSAMGGHVSACPNHQSGRTTPLEFRAHVAMMCGSFGFELDPLAFTPEEKKVIPTLIALSERISPLVIRGDQYRLASPDDSNWPSVQYVSEDGLKALVIAFQVESRINVIPSPVRLQGLNDKAQYLVQGIDKDIEATGSALMHAGLMLAWAGDYQSQVIWLTKR